MGSRRKKPCCDCGDASNMGLVYIGDKKKKNV